MGRVHQKGQRRFKHLRHFIRVGPQRKAWLHQPHHGRDGVARARHVRRQLAQHLYVAARQAHFFLGLAQRRGRRAGIFRIRLAARKSHLSGVAGQVRRALRQQHCHPLRALYQRHQHRRCRQRAAGAGQVRFAPHFRLPGGRRGKALAQRLRRQPGGCHGGQVRVHPAHRDLARIKQCMHDGLCDRSAAQRVCGARAPPRSSTWQGAAAMAGWRAPQSSGTRQACTTCKSLSLAKFITKSQAIGSCWRRAALRTTHLMLFMVVGTHQGE